MPTMIDLSSFNALTIVSYALENASDEKFAAAIWLEGEARSLTITWAINDSNYVSRMETIFIDGLQSKAFPVVHDRFAPVSLRRLDLLEMKTYLGDDLSFNELRGITLNIDDETEFHFRPAENFYGTMSWTKNQLP
jgi:hypothetical protein